MCTWNPFSQSTLKKYMRLNFFNEELREKHYLKIIVSVSKCNIHLVFARIKLATCRVDFALFLRKKKKMSRFYDFRSAFLLLINLLL